MSTTKTQVRAERATFRKKLLGWICESTGHWFSFAERWVFNVKTNDRNRDYTATLTCKCCGETFVHINAPDCDFTSPRPLKQTGKNSR